jgi:xyloglucan-specific endo-beta-1,4-glucanase
MIWLANFNAGPISAVYNSNGTPQPIASGISLAGHTWFVLKHKIALQ